MTNTIETKRRTSPHASAPIFAILRFSILSSVIVSSADAFLSGSQGRSSATVTPSGRSVHQPLRASELKESAQFNDTVMDKVTQDAILDEIVPLEVLSADSSETLGGLSDEDMVRNMSEQMSDLLTTLDADKVETQDADYDDDIIYSQLEAHLEADVTSSSISDIVDEMLHGRDEDYEEEDPILKELEETLLGTIQVLEDTLQETQIVNELETRELREEKARLQQELQEQRELNEQFMKKLELERQHAEQLIAASKAKQISAGGVESLLNPSTIPEAGVVITASDLDKFLQIQQERQSQEIKAFELKLKQEEEKRLKMEQTNVRLEAAASVAKAIAQDTKQEDTALQTKLREQQELLELANLKVEKLEADLGKSEQALQDQSASLKTEQAAAKAKEQELEEKIQKLEAEMKSLTMRDNKAEGMISNLEATQTELEETLKKVKHDKATSKAASEAAQKELKQTKQSLAESLAKIGRLETKLAKTQMQSQPRKAQAKQLPPKSTQAASTAQKIPRLENWELTDAGEIQGFVYNHPSLPDREPIRTSALVNPKLAKDGAMVKTSSGTRYKLGHPKNQASPQSTAVPATGTKPESSMKEPLQYTAASPVSKKEPEPKKKSEPINLFASFQTKPKEPVKKEDPKPSVEEEEAPKAKTVSPSLSSIFGLTSAKADETEEPTPTEEETPSIKNVSPALSSIFGIANTKVQKAEEPEVTAENEEPKPSEGVNSFPLPRINFFGSTSTEEDIKEANDESNDNEGSKSKPFTPFNFFGSKPAATKNDKTTNEKQEKSKPEPVTAPGTSAYGRRKIQFNEKEDSNEELNLTGQSICGGKYLLAGKAKKSVTGRCLILGAYHADANSNPTGNPVVIKLSENTDAMKKEHSMYRRVASAVNKGVVVKCHNYFPEVEDRPGKSALVLERGTRDLKEHRRWIGFKGDDLKEALYSVAQVLDSIHGARMVWTDLKTENFVVVENEDGHKVKAIDLESAMNLNDHPKDFTPEASPPEFAKEYVSGDPHSFVLNYSFDIWSFGMLAYELAAGVGYYDGNSADAIMQKLSQKNVPNPTIGIEDDDLSDLISQCLSLDPKQRPSAQKIVRHPYFASVAKPTLFNLW